MRDTLSTFETDEDAGARPSVAETEVLIINLADAAFRLGFQKDQMASLGLSFTRVEAIAQADFDEITLSEYSRRAPRPLIPGELACLLSHAECWKRIVKQDKPFLVVEDDVVLSTQLPELLDQLAGVAQTRLVNLETFLDHPKYLSRRPHKRFSGQTCDLFSVIKGSGGSAAYIIGPAIARRFLDALNKRVSLADTFIGVNSGARNLQTVPALAAQMMTLHAIYGAEFAEVPHSTILTGDMGATRGGSKLRKLTQNPRSTLRRLSLEIRVGLEKFEAALFGQKLKIQPSRDLLDRWA
ncbi:MAG: glycosyltransferase family 25 protein [Pseudomonadota bacterium]